MPTWYYMSSRNERVGPLEDAAMREAAANGFLHADSLVFKLGNSEWNRARDFTELFPDVAVPPPPPPVLPWSVTNVANRDGTWGCEIRFPEASPAEFQAMSGLLQQYAAIQSPLLPKVSITADRVGLLFLFPPATDGAVAAQVNFPLNDGETEMLRAALLRTAETLHHHGLGLWVADQRLLFRVGDRYLTIPAVWLPALSGRSGYISGVAPEWRSSGSQPQADIYAIAYICFAAVVGKRCDHIAQQLPGDVLPAARAWDVVLGSALQQLPAHRPESIERWLVITPFPATGENGALKTIHARQVAPTGNIYEYEGVVDDVEVRGHPANQKNFELHVKIPMDLDRLVEKSSNTVSQLTVATSEHVNKYRRKLGNLIAGVPSPDENAQEITTDTSSTPDAQPGESFVSKSGRKIGTLLSTKGGRITAAVIAASVVCVLAGAFWFSGGARQGRSSSIERRAVVERGPTVDRGSTVGRRTTVSGNATYNFWMSGKGIIAECGEIMKRLEQQNNDVYVNAVVALIALEGMIVAFDQLPITGVDARAVRAVANVKDGCVNLRNFCVEASRIQQMYGNNIPDSEKVKAGFAVVAIVVQFGLSIQEFNETAQTLSREYGISFPKM